MNDSVYTIPEVAKHLKLSKSKVYYLVQQRKIPHVRIGRNVRIKESDLRAWMDENSVSVRN
ncbi:MAG: helix-turn-helix domain-containing protein [Anaerolineales bacterium]|nr:helix-turn-helix domain-containing protein [Anaerolineales bacterium]